MNETLEAEKFEETQIKEIFNGHKAFFTGQSVTFLFGAGCSVKAGLPLMNNLTCQVLETLTGGELDCRKTEVKKTLDLIAKSFPHPENGREVTIEDYMSDIADYISVAERHDENFKVLFEDDAEVGIEELENALSFIKKEILSIIREGQKTAMELTKKQPTKLADHIKFVEMIYLAGNKVDYFILNYDTLIETALGLNKIKYADGFSSGPIGWFEGDAFGEKEIKTCVHKLHGSIDWSLIRNEPRRIDPNHPLISEGDDILIYPSAKKTTEVYHDPFIGKLISFRKALRENKSLIICGYGFGDSHINLEIEEALKSNELKTLIIFVDRYSREEKDRKSEVINKWFEYSGEEKQMNVYAENGFFTKDTKQIIKGCDSEGESSTSDCYKFERIVKLLEE